MEEVAEGAVGGVVEGALEGAVGGAVGSVEEQPGPSTSAAAGAAEPAPAATQAGEPDPAPEREYGHMHKLVLQGLMSAGMLNFKGVKCLFRETCNYLNLNPTEYTKMTYMWQVVREINDKIRPFGMAVRSASCELSGQKFYIFLLTVEKPLMKFQTLFTKFEVEYFQKIMDKCLLHYNTFSIPLTECMNMSKEIDSKVRLEVAEAFLNKMMNIGYLAKYLLGKEDFSVTLGFRGIREFEPVLCDMYKNIVTNCRLCRLILLHGFICPHCRCHVHKPCYFRFYSACQECPECKGSWDLEGMIVRTRMNEGLDVPDPEATSSGATSSRDDIQKQLQEMTISVPAGEDQMARSSGITRQVMIQPRSPSPVAVVVEEPEEPEAQATEANVEEQVAEGSYEEEMDTSQSPEQAEVPDPEEAEVVEAEAEAVAQPKAAPRKRRRGRGRKGNKR